VKHKKGGGEGVNAAQRRTSGNVGGVEHRARGSPVCQREKKGEGGKKRQKREKKVLKTRRTLKFRRAFREAKKRMLLLKFQMHTILDNNPKGGEEISWGWVLLAELLVEGKGGPPGGR